jgi:large conductance mechanosensitive channel
MTFDPLKTLPTKQVTSFFDEFRKFAFKGNMIDMAIAVVIGTAFTALVNSFVKNIVMQLVAAVVALFGTEVKGYEGLTLPLGNGVELKYGAFLAELLNFLIVAFAVFLLMVKVIGWLDALRKRATGEGAAPVVEPPPTKDQLLLMEIRDLLKAQQAQPAKPAS